jgi:photosystem II stability/assembly factor-like uncharacterized protein
MSARASARVALLLALLGVGLVAVGLWLFAGEDPEAAPAPRGAFSGAYEALAEWTSVRAYPGFDLPSEGYAEAVAVRRAMEAASRQALPAWESIGPHNIAGRMLAIVLNPERPETVWAGSASGGLWRSYSGGVGTAAWERVSTGFGVLAASAIAMLPADTSTLYLGTGEVYRYAEALGGVVYRPTRGAYGMGILKTTDGGQTWAKSLDWERHQERGVQMLRIDPSEPETVWAATTEGVFVTRDGGGVWEQVLDVVMATDVTVNPADSDDVIAVCGNQESPGYGFYRTQDGGQTWQQLTDGIPASYVGKVLLDRHPTESGTVYASVGDGIFTSGSNRTLLLRTTDGGATWETLSTVNYANYQGWFAHYVGVSPHTPSLVIAAGVNLYRSTNGGTTLTQVSGGGTPTYPPIGGPDSSNPNYIHVDHHAMAFHPTDPGVLYFANDGGVFRSDDGGQTFESVNGGLQTTQFYNGISVAPHTGDYALGGLQDNGSVRFDGTLRYRRVFGGDGGWSAINPTNPNVAYVSWQNLNIQRSYDSGLSFSAVVPPNPGGARTAFIAPFALAPSRPSTLYAGRSVVFKSTDRGSTWAATNGGAPIDPNNNPTLALAVSPVDHDVVYASTAPLLRDPVDTPGPPRLFVTRDGGASWQDVTLGLPDRFVTDIAIHPSDDATAVVTMGGFGTPHVFLTTDSGTTWADVTGTLPDAPTNAAAFDPLAPEQLFVGNDVGVFRSPDGGQTWEPFSEALPEAVMAMDLVYSPADRTLHVGTYGNGRYRVPLGPPPVASEDGAAPARFRLAQNAPNPFRSATTLVYELDEAADVRLEVFDAAGRRVAVLADGPAAAGAHRVEFVPDGLAAGTYLARLTAGGTEASRRMTLVR